MRLSKRGAILGGIVLLAIVVRLIHVWQLSSDLFFAAPVIDARLNVEDARYLIETNWWGPPTAYWKPPLYSYVLASQFQLVGVSYWVPRILQVLMDAGSCLLVFGIAAQLFSRRVAYGSAAATALCGPMIYFSGELVSATLVVFVDLGFIYLALRLIRDPGSRVLGAACGGVLGVAALARPEILLLAPALPIWLALRQSRLPGWRRFAVAGAFTAGVVGVVFPVTVRNAVRGGDVVLVSANGGINFYIGTEPSYGGMVGVRPGPEWERLVREPEGEGIGGVGGAHSRYYTRKALGLIARDPLGQIGHSLKKAILFWHGHELVSNQDLYRARQHSAVLRALVWHAPGVYFPFGLIAPLALLGMVIALRQRHPARVLLPFVGVFVVVAMLFFVTSRFRVPTLPILIMFAAFAVEWCVLQWRERRLPIFAAGLAAVAASGTVLNADAVFAADRASYRAQVVAEEHHYRGTVLFDVHERHADAIIELRRAAQLDPHRAQTYFNLGRAAAHLRRHQEVIDAMRSVVRIADGNRGERYLIGSAMRFLVTAATHVSADDAPFIRALHCQARGDMACAITAFEQASAPVFAGFALARRGEQRLRRGEFDAGIADLVRAGDVRPGDAYTQLVLAAGLENRGHIDRANAALARFRATDWPRGEIRRGLETAAPAPGSFERALLDLARR